MISASEAYSEKIKMGKPIIKLSGEGRDFYLEWSTVVDAPVTYGMSLEESVDELFRVN